ncbi:hypothetical protein [Cellulomonas humilata]|uniref:Lipoprotein n=1 Tax=Cellulomonas humilata TaxID=144055 RepID=A0ABU0EEL2_9CELL|nr:hypothetical protein [Cellulomonas humilata]MDQ0373714.1 hypothetical protein [Cellulomonas humilata]
MSPLPPTPPPAGRRQRVVSALAAVCLLGAVAACTPTQGPLLPGAGGATSGAPSPSSTVLAPEDAMLAWAQCMRDHGVDVPDSTDGHYRLGDAEGITPGQAEAADDACEPWQRMAESGAGSEPLTAEQKQSFLDHAQCMRDRGWDMPDPTFDGGRVESEFRRGAEAGAGAPAPDDPQFQGDMQECLVEAGVEAPDGSSDGQER